MGLNFIVIEGNIGAGKTSLAKKLSSDLKGSLILERFEDNAFLPLFYKDIKRYGFPTELSFMADRYSQLKEQLMPSLFDPIIISDYYFMKSLIFSRITLNEDEYKLFRKLFDIVYQYLPRPDLLVYLNVSTKRLQENIRLRNRSFESEIETEYLDKIHKSYLDFFSQTDFPVLILDVEELDFVNNVKDYQTIKDAITQTPLFKGIKRLSLNGSK